MLTVLRYSKREYWTSELRAATGRSLIRHLLTLLNRPPVLMPSYVPDGVIGPCNDAGVSVNFYELNHDLTPNIESINENIATGAVVIVIHYFGYPSPTCEVRRMVDYAKGILFEDCAQTLYDDVSKAHDADIALWSLNKFMPVTDGAILRARRPSILSNYIFPIQSPEFFWPYKKHLLTNSMIAKIEEPGLELACLRAKSAEQYEEYYNRINSDYTVYQQTEESKLIESQFDVEKEKAIRTANAWRMSMILPGLRENGSLPQFAFPLMCESAEHRETVAEKLLGLGILAARQVEKWSDGPKDFMDRHLLLPLGEVMDQELIGQIKGVL